MIIVIVLCANCASTPSYPKTESILVDKLNLMFKSPTLFEHIEISENGIRLYEDLAAKQLGQAEFAIFPDEYDAFKTLAARLSTDSLLALYLQKGTERWPTDVRMQALRSDSSNTLRVDRSLPLSGLKIALDPGHISGDMATAMIEGKYVRIRPTAATGMKEIGFFEPNLTLATAHLIRKQLLELGAEVLMTRLSSGVNTRGISFETWKREYIQTDLQRAYDLGFIDSSQVAYLQREPTDKELFANLYNRLDLWDRAQKINAFQPDLTLIIHYNVDSDSWRLRDEEGYFPASDKNANYNMAFVPGSFMAGELAKPEDRLALLRMILTDNVAQSITLSEAIVSQMTQKLGVPPVAQDAPLRYLEIASLPTKARGVFARNLTLTRLIKGPLCYGESLCQDGLEEALRLNQQDIVVAGIRAPSRVRAVADAYVAGVMEYLEQNRP